MLVSYRILIAYELAIGIPVLVLSFVVCWLCPSRQRRLTLERLNWYWGCRYTISSREVPLKQDRLGGTFSPLSWGFYVYVSSKTKHPLGKTLGCFVGLTKPLTRYQGKCYHIFVIDMCLHYTNSQTRCQRQGDFLSPPQIYSKSRLVSTSLLRLVVGCASINIPPKSSVTASCASDTSTNTRQEVMGTFIRVRCESVGTSFATLLPRILSASERASRNIALKNRRVYG